MVGVQQFHVWFNLFGDQTLDLPMQKQEYSPNNFNNFWLAHKISPNLNFAQYRLLWAFFNLELFFCTFNPNCLSSSLQTYVDYSNCAVVIF